MLAKQWKWCRHSPKARKKLGKLVKRDDFVDFCYPNPPAASRGRRRSRPIPDDAGILYAGSTRGDS